MEKPHKNKHWHNSGAGDRIEKNNNLPAEAGCECFIQFLHTQERAFAHERAPEIQPPCKLNQDKDVKSLT